MYIYMYVKVNWCKHQRQDIIYLRISQLTKRNCEDSERKIK